MPFAMLEDMRAALSPTTMPANHGFGGTGSLPNSRGGAEVDPDLLRTVSAGSQGRAMSGQRNREKVRAI